MKILTDLFSPMSPVVQITWRIVEKYKLPVTRTSLQKDLTEHPDYPSLLSISDVLTSYRIENVAASISSDEFEQLPLPFIVYIKNSASQDAFGLVESVNKNGVELYTTGPGKTQQLSYAEFNKIYRGTALALEVDDQAGESDFAEKRRAEKQTAFLRTITTWLFPFVVLTASIAAIIQFGINAAIVPVLYLLVSLAGCVAGVLLLVYEIDEYNPALKQICQGHQRVNCSAVLHSSASRIFGLSWSQLGFTYFLGLLLAQLTSGIVSLPVLQVLSWLSIAAILYTVFSVYYQWKIVKQWCVLCLAVQALLVVQAIIVIAAGYYSLPGGGSFFVTSLLSVAASMAIALIGVVVAIPAFQKAKLVQGRTSELQRLKHNKEIFDSLLTRQKRIEKSPAGLGITLGSPDAKYRLIKVCNPYCGPCARAHSAIEELVHINPDISVQIIFTATGEEDDFRSKPVAHLMAIEQQKETSRTGKALHDWYTAEKKEYETFAGNYPLNGEVEQQGHKLKAMSEWCKITGIAFTPTFFVSLPAEENPDNVSGNQAGNFYQLPEMYTVNDLKYFFAQ